MADLELNVSTTKYNARISTLEGYVSSLNNLLSEYQAKRNQVNVLWESDEAEEYKKAVDDNMRNVQMAIDTAQSNIRELQKVVEGMNTSNTAVQTIVEEAADMAKKLFT